MVVMVVIGAVLVGLGALILGAGWGALPLALAVPAIAAVVSTVVVPGVRAEREWRRG